MNLLDVYLGAVAQMDPTKLVKARVRAGALDDWLGDLERPRQLHVLAIGKAAPTMLWGLVECSVPFKGVGIVPHGVRVPLVDTFTWHRGNHPTPQSETHDATDNVLAWVDALPEDAHVLVLLSGGASSLLETKGGTDSKWDQWLRKDWDIVTMNEARQATSDVKNGRLATRILSRTSKLQAWVLSDIGPNIRMVGSGPLNLPEVAHHCIAQGSDLAAAAKRLVPEAEVVPMGTHLEEAVQQFLLAKPGQLRIAVGEPRLAVPLDAPPGGRAHHAALLAKQQLPKGWTFLAAGSDGDDGGVGSGAMVTGGTWEAADAVALSSFDAAKRLEATGKSFDIGPTGCNLNDIWLLQS